MKFFDNKSPISSIIKFTITSHLITLALVVFWGSFTPFDSSLDLALLYTPNSSMPPGFHSLPLPKDSKSDSILYQYFAPLFNWDGIFFLKTTLSGYSFEHQHAFFFLLQWFHNNIIHLFQSFISISSLDILIISHIMTSLLLKLIIAISIYHLGELLHFGKNTTWNAVAFFSLSNPATIFFTSYYTEALFLCLVSLGVVCFHTWHLCSYSGISFATFFFALASFTRGNGIILAGFPLFRWIHMVVLSTKLNPKHPQKRSLISHLFQLIFTLFLVSLIILPNIFTQYYAYTIYCRSSGSQSQRPWCSATPPSIYSYIQGEYWGNGLFKYYTPNQIPNFILAAPIIIFTSFALWRRFKSLYPGRPSSEFVVTTTTSTSSKFKLQVHPPNIPNADAKIDLPLSLLQVIENWLLTGNYEFVHIVYLAVLLCISIFLMNIQVTTRFILASNPYIYLILNDLPPKWQEKLTIWGFIYAFVGIALFSTFLPWT